MIDLELVLVYRFSMLSLSNCASDVASAKKLRRTRQLSQQQM